MSRRHLSHGHPSQINTFLHGMTLLRVWLHVYVCVCVVNEYYLQCVLLAAAVSVFHAANVTDDEWPSLWAIDCQLHRLQINDKKKRQKNAADIICSGLVAPHMIWHRSCYRCR